MFKTTIILLFWNHKWLNIILIQNLVPGIECFMRKIITFLVSLQILKTAKHLIKALPGDFPGGPVDKTPQGASNAGGLGSIPGQGTISHMHAETKSSHATTKEPTCCN